MADWDVKECCNERKANEPSEKGIHPVLQGAATIAELEKRKKKGVRAGREWKEFGGKGEGPAALSGRLALCFTKQIWEPPKANCRSRICVLS
jgi:hypothetical protein